MNIIYVMILSLSLSQEVVLTSEELLKGRACYKIIEPYLQENEKLIRRIFEKRRDELPGDVLLRLKYDLYKMCDK